MLLNLNYFWHSEAGLSMIIMTKTPVGVVVMIMPDMTYYKEV